MEHIQATEMFSSYWDGDLTPAEVAALEEHLRDCHVCHEEYQQFRQAMGALGGLAKVPVPAPLTFTEGVVERVRRRSGGRFFNPRRRHTRFPYEMVSALMLIIILLIYLMFQLSQPGSVLIR